MIPDEAIEAGANAMFRAQTGRDLRGSKIVMDLWRRLARETLEAAAPHLMAQAWDQGWDKFADFDSRPGGPYPENPYR